MKKSKVYTAPDGKEFTKRSEYRKYVFATFYTIENKTNELIVKNPGEIAGNPFKVKGCTDCTVLLLDCCEQTELSNLTRCRIFVAAGKASIKCDTCKDCIFTVGCKQLRLRYVYDCVFNLYALTPPVIEYSHHLVFKPFNGAFAGLGALLTKARLDPAIDTWSQVHDFSEEDGSVPQPHFTINETPSSPWVVMVPTEGDAVNPVTGTKYTEFSPLKIGCPVQGAPAAAASAAPAAAPAPAAAATDAGPPLPPGAGAAAAAPTAPPAAPPALPAAAAAAQPINEMTTAAVGDLAPLIAGLQQLVEKRGWHSVSLSVNVNDPASGDNTPFQVTLKPPTKRKLTRGLSVEATGPPRAGTFHSSASAGLEVKTLRAGAAPGLGLSISPSGPPRAGAFHAASEVKTLRPGGAVGIGLSISPHGAARAGTFHKAEEVKAGITHVDELHTDEAAAAPTET